MNSIWTQRVRDLSAAGMTYAEIGAVVHLAPSTIGDLAAGKYKSPRGDAAILLAQLHKERCSDAVKNTLSEARDVA